MHRALSGVCLLILVSACEHGITLTGTVQVAASLTDEFTEAQPGLVIVSSSVPKSSVPTYRLAVLCEPSSEEITLHWEHDGFGCAKEGTVTARLFRADSDAVGAGCGIATQVGGAPESALLRREASTVVFAGKDEKSGCSDGTDSPTLRLAPQDS